MTNFQNLLNCNFHPESSQLNNVIFGKVFKYFASVPAQSGNIGKP